MQGNNDQILCESTEWPKAYGFIRDQSSKDEFFVHFSDINSEDKYRELADRPRTSISNFGTAETTSLRCRGTMTKYSVITSTAPSG
jgi:hypothetical protein